MIKMMTKVVLQRASLREDEEDSEEEAEVRILTQGSYLFRFHVSYQRYFSPIQIPDVLYQRYFSIKSQVYTLQLAQLIAVAVLLCAV